MQQCRRQRYPWRCSLPANLRFGRRAIRLACHTDAAGRGGAAAGPGSARWAALAEPATLPRLDSSLAEGLDGTSAGCIRAEL
jgi:hypothetical protein